MAKRKSIHYVNNAEFSQAVVDYVTKVRQAEKNETSIPIVPNYIAQCFLRIAEGLSHKSNFSRYTYREEMVMDAVENCLRAVHNYNLEVATRTGKPNAFAYFTQISWFAFLRRIAKEKKQQDVKLKYLYGRNIGTDVREGPFVTEITKKLAAIEILKNSDFGNLTVSGMDRVPLQQKLQLFQVEVAEGIESLKRVEIF